MKHLLLLTSVLMPAMLATGNAAAQDRTTLPVALPPFQGRVAQTVDQSAPDYPGQIAAVAGSPNILLVMTDDVGFGAASAFGGPIPTPNLERLAQRGVVYNRFHTTAMCSPTRAALLTGRNPHEVGYGTIGELTMGYPGFWGAIPPSAASIARVLRDNGYNTAMFGKEHNVPHAQSSPAGPFNLWPNARGFEYFYGFVGGAMNQFSPRLFRNTSLVDLSHKPDDYILDRDLADQAIGWIHTQKAAAPDKPFFIYYAPGTAHSPHQAPSDWIARFRGQFDMGWDALRRQTFERQKARGIIPADTELTPRPEAVPAWTSLPAGERRVQARLMEVYAGMLAFQDAQFGRILDELDRMGMADDTLIIFIEGDNGGTMEGGPEGELNEAGIMANGLTEPLDRRLARLDELGGPRTMENYSAGWGWAANTPFQWSKQVVSHLGGTRNGMVIAWPGHVPSGGGIRSQYAHVSDIYPTLLEAAGLPAPRAVDGVAQQAIDGTSLVYSFGSADAPSRHNEQAYELFGNRAIYQDGWLANTRPRRLPWYYGPTSGSPLDYDWELYYLPDDFSQAHDVARRHPDRLQALQARWDALARKQNLYPLSDDFSNRNYADPARQPSAARDFTYWGAGISLPQSFGPPLFGRSFAIDADLRPVDGQLSGVILATGSHFGGWSFYIDQGRPVAYQAYSENEGDHYRIVGHPLPDGDVRLRFAFTYDGGGRNKGGFMRIYANGELAGEGRMERTITLPAGFGETFDIGSDGGAPVSPDYAREGSIVGEISKITVHLDSMNISHESNEQ